MPGTALVTKHDHGVAVRYRKPAPVAPGIAERVGPLLGPLASVSFGPLVTALVNELAGQSGEDDLLLILDPARGS